jgi:AcrR family transcriptional regulator
VSVPTKNSKEAKRLAVSIAVMEIVERDGLLGVTHSTISRKAKVSRAWLYEYIGRKKEALIDFAADEFGAHISGADDVLPKTKQELQAALVEGIDFLFDAAELNPTVTKIYFRFRGTDNPIGRMIQKYEKHWLNGAEKTLVDILGVSPDEATTLAELILILRLGFAHRLATTAKAKEARARAKKTFEFIHALLDKG